jgi:hypothetical protein
MDTAVGKRKYVPLSLPGDLQEKFSQLDEFIARQRAAAEEEHTNSNPAPAGQAPAAPHAGGSSAACAAAVRPSGKPARMPLAAPPQLVPNPEERDENSNPNLNCSRAHAQLFPQSSPVVGQHHVPAAPRALLPSKRQVEAAAAEATKSADSQVHVAQYAQPPAAQKGLNFALHPSQLAGRIPHSQSFQQEGVHNTSHGQLHDGACSAAW